MSDVRNTQRKDERLNALDALEGRVWAIGPEEVWPEQPAWTQTEVQTGLQATVQAALRTSEAVSDALLLNRCEELSC